MRTFLLGLPLLLLASACTYDNGNVHRVDTGNSGAAGAGTAPAGCSADTTPAQSAIDTDRALDIEPGQGAGIFVEYATGGHWSVRTSCDTLMSKTSCAWDIIVTPEDSSVISNVVPVNLESDDSVLRYPEDRVSYQLLATTGNDIDGFTFDADPGTAIRVDAYLDDACALPYFYWVGDDALHSGSPTNPLDLIPSAK